MTTAAVAMVKDEADVVVPVVEHMLGQVDFVIVADNNSTDGTRDLLAELDVTVVDDTEPGYFQSKKMTALAACARGRGADWIVPFDADEIWCSPCGPIREVLGEVAPQWFACAAKLYDHVATATDPAGSPTTTMGWRRREAAPLPKVACRARPDLTIEQGNHGARYDGGTTTLTGQLIVRHFPYRSAEQFIRKARNGAAAYAATNLPEDQGAHWRSYGRLLETSGEEVLADVFHTWFWIEEPDSDPTVIYDPATV